jgi:RNA polymerase primary sigma factor
VGQRFNITRERIRQLQDLAMRQIRHKMNERNKQRTWSEVKEELRTVRRMEILREFATQRGIRPSSTCVELRTAEPLLDETAAEPAAATND